MSTSVLVVGTQDPPEPFLAQMFEGVADRGVEIRTSPRAPRSTRRAVGHSDVVYVPWVAHAVAHPELFTLGRPVVVSCRGSQINSAPWNPERRALRDGLAGVFERAAAVHCVSEAIQWEAEVHGLDPSDAVVIRPGVDADRFGPPSPPRANGRIRLMSTGRVVWAKGYEYGLRALRRVLDRGVDAHYRVVGAVAGDGDAVRYAIDDLGLGGHVELAGACSPEEVADHLRTADIYLLPSVSEGIANGALEAMAGGLAVVVTDVGGMREAITDGRDGIVVPPRDDEAMAEAIVALGADPERRRSLGVEARARIDREFTLDAQCDAFARLFRSLAEAGS